MERGKGSPVPLLLPHILTYQPRNPFPFFRAAVRGKAGEERCQINVASFPDDSRELCPLVARIRFREEQIEDNSIRLVVFLESAHKLSVPRPGPGPSSDTRDAFVVDLDDRDAVGLWEWRACAKAKVIGTGIYPGQPPHRSHEECRQAADKPKPPWAYERARPYHLPRRLPAA